jgi:cell division control protein 11
LHQNPEDLHSQLDASAVADAAAQAHEEVPIRIKQHNIELEEDGARIALTIVDTPGFGEGIDNEHWFVASFGISHETRN